jgi:predicted O-linked N-acetylglucosamine transferase (SPINDLY family)
MNRCAPAQITYLGYPNTTGLSTMDYRLTDRWADPVGEEMLYTEKLYRLPHGFLCYSPLHEPPDVSELPALSNGFITFGSFNNLPKIRPSVIKTWSQLLDKVPNAKLVLKTKPCNDKNIRRRIKDLFIKNGVGEDRIVIKQYADSTRNHLLQYHDIDIALDTFPYNGTTTTCEALWMGVPTITLAGEHHAGRVGMSLLSQIGLGGMIARDTGHYIALASFLAGDIQRLANLRKGLRNAVSVSPLSDSIAFTRDLENGYREMWREKAMDSV